MITAAQLNDMSKELNIVNMEEYLIISPSDVRPVLGTESVRGCIVVLIHHPDRSLIVHWDDMLCHLDFPNILSDYLGKGLKLNECDVHLVGGWKDNIESKKSGLFLKNQLTKAKSLDLTYFLQKSSVGSLDQTGYSVVTLDSRAGSIGVSDDWDLYRPENDWYRGVNPKPRLGNYLIVGEVHMQNDKFPSSGTHVYPRDKYEELQHTQATKMCLSARDNKLKEIIQVIDQGITGVNVAPKNAKGWTALHYACKMKNFDVAELLINHGADIYLKNESGQTPLDYVSNVFYAKKLQTQFKLVQYNQKHILGGLRAFSLFSRHPEQVEPAVRLQQSQIKAVLNSEEGVDAYAKQLSCLNHP